MPAPGLLHHLLRGGAALLLLGLILWGDGRGGPPGSAWPGPPPGPGEGWEGLELASASGALRVTPPESRGGVVLTPPSRLRVGRSSILSAEWGRPDLRDGPREERVAVLRGPAGTLDSVPIHPLGEGPRAQAFLPLRPLVEGPQRWELDLPGESHLGSREWWGFADPPAPLQVIAISGPPGPELRFSLRALEEAGEEVEAWIHLGRELWIGREAALPLDEEAYRGRDVVLLFPGAPLDSAYARPLLRAVESQGMGLLVVGGGTESQQLLQWSGLASGWGGEVLLQGDELNWEVSPLLRPLPPMEAELRVQRLAGEGHDWIRLQALGRGRVAALGMEESWRWRMEEGREEEHRQWWSGWMDWLSDGLGPLPTLEWEAGEARVGEPLRLRMIGEAEGEREGDPEEGGSAPSLVVEEWDEGERTPSSTVPMRLSGEWEALGQGELLRKGGVTLPRAQGIVRIRPNGVGAPGETGEALPGEPAGPGPEPIRIQVLGTGDPGLDPGLRLSFLAHRSHGGGLGLPSPGVGEIPGFTPSRLQGLLFALAAGTLLLAWYRDRRRAF